MLVEHPVDVTFGDCDPAGIVFYPNYFRWMDATFHRLLQDKAGGHAALCRKLGAVGIGLMDAGLNFRVPVRPGQRLQFRLSRIDWGDRSLTLRYSADLEGRTALEGHEKRGIFVVQEGRMFASGTEPLRGLLEKG